MPFTAIAVDAEATYTTSDGTAEGSFLEAIANVTDGGTITLLKNIEVDGTVTSPISKSFTLLGGGYEVKITNGSIIIAGSAVVYLGRAYYSEPLKIYSTDNLSSIFNIQDSAKLYIYDNVTLGPSTCFNSAGGVHLSDDAELHMYGGTITDCNNPFSICGGVAVTDGSKFYMHGGTIQNCTGSEGGAISIHPGPAIGSGSHGTPTFEMTGGTISNCHDNNYGGGAIFSNAGSQGLNIKITGGRIENCSADNARTGYGGAISLWGDNVFQTSVSISGVTFYNNSAVLYGGAMLLNLPSQVDVELSNVSFESNSAPNGGAIFVNSGTLEFSGSNTFTGNKATNGGGGAVYLNKGEAEFSGTTFSGNSATSSGGAIYRTSSANFSFSGSNTVTSNSAASGGGLAVSNSGFFMPNNVSIYDNSASVQGDDIYVTGSGSFFAPDAPVDAQLSCGHTVDGWYYDAAGSRWGTGGCGAQDGVVNEVGFYSPLTLPAAIKAAHREVRQYAVTVEVEGEGTVTPGGGELTVNEGEDLTLSFAPAEGYYLKDVLLDGVSVVDGASLTLEDIRATHTVRVVFAELMYELSYFTYGGTEYETELHSAGTVVELDKVPVRSGYRFTGWFADEALTLPITSVTMDDHKSVHAGWERVITPVPPTPSTPDEPEVYRPNGLVLDEHFAYLIGNDDGLIRPEANITRAEVATIFFRLLTDETRESFWSDTNSYTDVAAGSWYNNAVSTLSAMGVLGGYEDGSFRPNASITRAEFAKIAVSFFELEGLDCENPFLDVAPGAWYAESVAAAAEIGLIEGYEGGLFRPDAPITRAEACTIVNRTLGRAPHAAGLLPESEMNLWPDNMDASAWYYAQIQEATNSHDFVWAGEFEQWTQKLPERDWDALQR
uniref:S-layer homology domain-containing protein n=1 Tax=Candidatus Scatomorpha intestinigallinarum TaxID=2840923 RepID=UPI004026A7A8